MGDVFKVKITGLDQILKDIQKALNETVKLSVMKNLGKLARQIIYKRTKSGYGVSDDHDPEPAKIRLAALSKPYIKYRSKLAKLGTEGKPGKSNLTLTGQMLDSIDVEGRRNGFSLKIKDNVRNGSTLTNRKVSEHVADNGRPFFALTAQEQVTLFREMEKTLRAELKRSLGSRSVK